MSTCKLSGSAMVMPHFTAAMSLNVKQNRIFHLLIFTILIVTMLNSAVDYLLHLYHQTRNKNEIDNSVEAHKVMTVANVDRQQLTRYVDMCSDNMNLDKCF